MMPLAPSVSGLPMPDFLSPLLPWVGFFLVVAIIAGLAKKAWSPIRNLLRLSDELRQLGPTITKVDSMFQDVASVKQQVQNSHVTNLREDMDATHGEVRSLGGKVDDLATEVRSVHKTNDRQWSALMRVQSQVKAGEPADPYNTKETP